MILVKQYNFNVFKSSTLDLCRSEKEEESCCNFENVSILEIKNKEYKTFSIPSDLFFFLKFYSNINFKNVVNDFLYSLVIDGKLYLGYHILSFIILVETNFDNNESKKDENLLNGIDSSQISHKIYTRFKSENYRVLRKYVEGKNINDIFNLNNNINVNKKNENFNEKFYKNCNLFKSYYNDFSCVSPRNKNYEYYSGCYYIDIFNLCLFAMYDEVSQKMMITVVPIGNYGLEESKRRILSFSKYENFIRKIIEERKNDPANFLNLMINDTYSEINNNFLKITHENYNKENLFYSFPKSMKKKKKNSRFTIEHKKKKIQNLKKKYTLKRNHDFYINLSKKNIYIILKEYEYFKIKNFNKYLEKIEKLKKLLNKSIKNRLIQKKYLIENEELRNEKLIREYIELKIINQRKFLRLKKYSTKGAIEEGNKHIFCISERKHNLENHLETKENKSYAESTKINKLCECLIFKLLIKKNNEVNNEDINRKYTNILIKDSRRNNLLKHIKELKIKNKTFNRINLCSEPAYIKEKKSQPILKILLYILKFLNSNVYIHDKNVKKISAIYEKYNLLKKNEQKKIFKKFIFCVCKFMKNSKNIMKKKIEDKILKKIILCTFFNSGRKNIFEIKFRSDQYEKEKNYYNAQNIENSQYKNMRNKINNNQRSNGSDYNHDNGENFNNNEHSTNNSNNNDSNYNNNHNSNNTTNNSNNTNNNNSNNNGNNNGNNNNGNNNGNNDNNSDDDDDHDGNEDENEDENEEYNSNNENNSNDNYKYSEKNSNTESENKKNMNGELLKNVEQYNNNTNKSEISTNYFENRGNISVDNSHNECYEENSLVYSHHEEGFPINNSNLMNNKPNTSDGTIFENMTSSNNIDNENSNSDNVFNSINSYLNNYIENNKRHMNTYNQDTYSNNNDEPTSSNSLNASNQMKENVLLNNHQRTMLEPHKINENVKEEVNDTFDQNFFKLKKNSADQSKHTDSSVQKKITKKRNKVKSEKSSKSLDDEKKEVLNKVSQITRVGGVCFDKNRQRWIAHWKIDGKYHKHYFPISQYGFENARERAVNCRKQAEKLFNLPEIQPRNRWNQIKVNGTSHLKKAAKLPRCEGVGYDELSQSWVSTFVVHKKFSIDEFGFYGARDKAIYCRKAFEKVNAHDNFEWLLKDKLGISEKEKGELYDLINIDKSSIENNEVGNKVKNVSEKIQVKDNEFPSEQNNENSADVKISNEQYLKITQEAIEMILNNIKHKSLPEIKLKLIDKQKFENYNTLLDKHFKFITSVKNISQLRPYISLFHKFIIYHTLPHNISLRKQLFIIEALEWSSFFSGAANQKID